MFDSQRKRKLSFGDFIRLLGHYEGLLERKKVELEKALEYFEKVSIMELYEHLCGLLSQRARQRSAHAEKRSLHSRFYVIGKTHKPLIDQTKALPQVRFRVNHESSIESQTDSCSHSTNMCWIWLYASKYHNGK